MPDIKVWNLRIFNLDPDDPTNKIDYGDVTQGHGAERDNERTDSTYGFIPISFPQAGLKMLSSSPSEHGMQPPITGKARPPDLESTIAALEAQVLATVVRPQLEEIKSLLLSIVHTLRPGRKQRREMIFSFVDRIVDLSVDVLIFLEATEDMQHEAVRDLLWVLQEVKKFILWANRLQSSPCSGSALTKVLSTKCHAYEQRISSLFETLASSLSNVPETGIPTMGGSSPQQRSHRSPSTLFSHARDFTIHGSDFYSAPGSTFHIVTNVVEGSSQNVGKPNDPSLVKYEDLELEREICKGRECRVHSARLHGKAVVVVKVFQGPRAKQLLLKNAELNREIMHPNVLRLIGGPAPDSRSSFLLFDGDYHETVESQLAMALKKGIKDGYVIGANTVITCSLGLDYLQELGLPFSLMNSDHFSLMVSKQGRIVLTFDADVTWDLASNNLDRLVTTQSDTVKKICNEVIQKTFYSSCKKYYRDQRVYDNDADEVHLENDDGFDQDDDLERPLPEHNQDAPDRSSASRKSPQKAKGHRRELVWKPTSTSSDSLEEIGQHYQASLAQIRFENILVHRRSQSATQIAHRCLGYKRTEIVLTPDIKRSGIVSHISPVPNEICSVCGQNVGTKTILHLLRALPGTGVGGNGDNSVLGVESSGLPVVGHFHQVGKLGAKLWGVGELRASFGFGDNQQRQGQGQIHQWLYSQQQGGGGGLSTGQGGLQSYDNHSSASLGGDSRSSCLSTTNTYHNVVHSPQNVSQQGRLQRSGQQIGLQSFGSPSGPTMDVSSFSLDSPEAALNAASHAKIAHNARQPPSFHSSSGGTSDSQEDGLPSGLGMGGLGLGFGSEHAQRQQRKQQFNGLIGGGGGPSIKPAIDAQGNLIAKQNLTTGRTADASIQRRKPDATFACPVPGCNSTFTRRFNFKGHLGHLRSHTEKKPYKCHWLGCEKTFARQQDCKRHEQLHSNFRLFECVGCRKQFARIDALDRHLNSEAGAECARLVERAREAGGVGGVNVNVNVANQGMGGMMGGGMIYGGNGGMGMGMSMDVDIEASA